MKSIELMTVEDNKSVRDLNINGIYQLDRNDTTFFMALGTAVKKDKVGLLSSFETCRERIVGLYATLVQRSQLKEYPEWKEQLKLTENSFTLLVARRIASNKRKAEREASKQKFLTDMEKSVRLINTVEKLAGWPLTKAYEVNTIPYRKNGSLLMAAVSGNQRWAKNPYFLSLYLLLIRTGRLPITDAACSDVAELKQFVVSNNKEANWLTNYYLRTDLHNLSKIVPHILNIMTHANTIIGTKKKEAAYAENFVGRIPTFVGMGINMLLYYIGIKNSIADYRFQERFVKAINGKYTNTKEKAA